MAVRASDRAALKVRDLMTDTVFVLDMNQSVTEIDKLMDAKDVHHVPVIDEYDGKLVGVVSARDVFANALLRAAGYGSVGATRLKEDLRIKDVMTSQVRTTTPDTPIPEAAEAMRLGKLGCLPVLEDGKLVGMLTASDLLELIAESG